MDCINIVLFLAFSHFACSWPLSTVSTKQDHLSDDVHRSACNDFKCLTKFFHQKMLRKRNEDAHKKAISPPQSKDKVVNPLKAIWNFLPNSKPQYLHALMKKTVNENVNAKLPHHYIPHINQKTGEIVNDNIYSGTNKQLKLETTVGGTHEVRHTMENERSLNKDVFVDIPSDVKESVDPRLVDLLNQSRQDLMRSIMEQLKVMYPQSGGHANTRTTTSRWQENRQINEWLKKNQDVDQMNLKQLEHMLHTLLSRVDIFRTTIAARIPPLHNICCDIG